MYSVKVCQKNVTKNAKSWLEAMEGNEQSPVGNPRNYGVVWGIKEGRSHRKTIMLQFEKKMYCCTYTNEFYLKSFDFIPEEGYGFIWLIFITKQRFLFLWMLFINSPDRKSWDLNGKSYFSQVCSFGGGRMAALPEPILQKLRWRQM